MPENERCEHEADLSRMVQSTDDHSIVDIPCAKCGILGSVQIPEHLIFWDE